MSIPTNLSYTAEHEWISRDGETAQVGITAFAADALGDVVFVDLPELGNQVSAGEACGELESTKSVSELFAPVDGEVVKVNDAVVADPSLVNTDPYGEGWLFVVKVSAEPQTLDADAYAALLEG